MSKKKEYALYSGDKLLSMGTLEEIAKEMNVKPDTVYFYKSQAYKRRLHNPDKRGRVLVSLSGRSFSRREQYVNQKTTLQPFKRRKRWQLD